MAHYQECPHCKGTGIEPYWIFNDSSMVGVNSICSVCGGKKLILVPDIDEAVMKSMKDEITSILHDIFKEAMEEVKKKRESDKK